MSNESDLTAEELKEIREKYSGTPLEPRAKWVLKQALFVLACAVALVAVLKFADGIWLAIGLTVVAFFAGMLPELFADFRYGKYRKNWEIANTPDLENS